METKIEHPESHQGGSIPPASIILNPGPASAARPVSKISAARSAVREFFSTELGAREIRITKIGPLTPASEGWEAEVEILVPNLEVKMLNLPLTQEVLEIEHYALELETDLSVRSYGPLSAAED